MKIEFKKGPSNIDPWVLEDLLKIGKNVIVTDDIAHWVRVEGHSFRCLPDTETRISSGEDPEKVLLDSLEFWRPGMKRKINILGRFIEIGVGEIDPKRLWRMWASGKSILYLNGKQPWWIYINDEPPFQVVDGIKFYEELEMVKTEEELELLLSLYGNKN